MTLPPCMGVAVVRSVTFVEELDSEIIHQSDNISWLNPFMPRVTL